MSETIDQLVSTANPFPGLRPFKIEESHLFFGREGQSDEVLLKLSKNRFIGVIGPSGSGKSSFIYCGVMPILYGGFLTDASPDWEVVVTRPGAGPIDNLAEALLKNNPEYGQADAEEKKIKRTIFSTLLRSSSLGLVEAVEQTRKKKDVNYLILVDQFEELFRFKDSHHDNNSINETLAFVNLLIEAVNYPDAPIYVAITMRSDFIGDCAQFPELTRKINDSHYLIPQLTREQKRRAIEGPVAVGGAKISARLTQQLLNDLGDNPDQLPILQHALMRTWSYWGRYKDYEEEPLDLKHYEAIGTMREALSMHANEAYDELTEDQKRICEVLFKAITEKRGENFGIRRPTKLNEIAAIADVSEEEVAGVIEKFREPGRSLLTPAFGTPMTGKSMIDISHESLMRIWVRLKNWVDDEADAVQMYIRLAEAASMYQVGKAGLWRPPDLQLALNWQAKHKPTLVWGQRYNPAFERTMIFLEYSKKEWETEQRIKELEQKRKLQRARIVAAVLASATFISIIFLVFAFIQKAQADAAKEDALAQKVLADKNAEEAKIAAAEALRQQKIAEEQKLAADAAKNEAIQAQQLAEQNAELARKNEAKALEQEKLAKRNEAKAIEQEKIAKQREEEAKRASELALRRQYIATAKAMAIKSKEISDPILEALMAQQAFIFNNKYDGYTYDDAIYNGLHEALEKFKHPLTLDLEGHEKGSARSLVIHMASKKLFSGGSDGRILRWTYTGKQWAMEQLVGPRTTYPVYTVAVNKEGTMLAAGGLVSGDATKNYIELYDLRGSIAAPKLVQGYLYDIENLTFTPDGKGLYARDNSGHSIRFSDLSTSREIVASKEKLNGISVNKTGTMIAAAGNDGTLYVYDAQNNYAAKELYKNPATNDPRTGKQVVFGFTAVGFTPDGKQIVVGDQNGTVKILPVDYKQGSRVQNLSGHTSGIEEIVFANTSKFMATASDDKTVRIWNLDNLREQPIVLSGHADWVRTAVFSADDEQLLAGMHSNAEKSKETIHAWPTKIETISGLLCDYITRNLTEEEWQTYADPSLPYEITCQGADKKKK